jgi:hypothetical protein
MLLDIITFLCVGLTGFCIGSLFHAYNTRRAKLFIFLIRQAIALKQCESEASKRIWTDSAKSNQSEMLQMERIKDNEVCSEEKANYLFSKDKHTFPQYHI